MRISTPIFRCSLAAFMLLIASQIYSQISLPYDEDFESDDGGWTTSGTSSSWEYGTTTTGSKGWATSLSGNYNNDELSYLESPVFDMSALADDPILQFDLSYVLESGWDYLWFEVSTDSGANYTRITSSQLEYVSSNRWNGTGSLHLEKLTLDTLAGKSEVRFRFVFDSDVSSTYAGVVFDNFSLRDQPSVDLSVISSNVPTYSASINEEFFTIEVVNEGKDSQSNIPLVAYIVAPSGEVSTLQETALVTVDAQDTLEYTFTEEYTFSEIGVYSVNFYHELSGDEIGGNDSLLLNTKKLLVYNGGLPLEIDFDDLDLLTYTPSLDSITTIPGLGYVASTDNGRLNFFQDIYSFNGTTSLKLKRNEYSNVLTNNQLIWTIDASAYDVSSDVLLLDFTFSVYSPRYSTDNQVYVRGSEEDEWVAIYNWYNNVPTNYTWKGVQYLNISETLSVAGQQFSEYTQIKISENEYYSNDYLAIDEFRVYEQPVNDASITNLSLVEQSSLFTSTEDVTLEVTNYGSSQQTSIPVKVVAVGPNGTQEATGTVTDVLDYEGSAEITLSGQLDFSTSGTYQISGFTSLDTDTFHSNDTLTHTIYSMDVYDEGLPYTVDFDSEEDLTVNIGSGTVGEVSGLSYLASTDYGKLQVAELSDAYSGKSLFLSRTTNFATYNSVYITLDLSDLAVADNKVQLDFNFKENYESSTSSDGVYIRGSESEDWVLLYEWDPADANNNVWQEAQYIPITDTLAANGQEFSASTQIKFTSYGSNTNGNNFALDNISVYEQPANDLGLYAISTVNDGPFYSDSEEVNVSVINYGADTQTEIPVSVEVNGPNGTITLNQTFAGSIATFDTATFVFTQTVDLSAPGYYYMDGVVALGTDTEAKNDSVTYVATTYSKYEGSLPYILSFDGLEDTTYAPNQQDMLGLDGFGFTSSTEYGLVGIVTDSYYGEAPVLQLTRNSYNSSLNSLTLTLDLDTVDTDTENIMLDFDFMITNGTSNTSNKVFVRGSLEDDWVSLYDWYANRGSYLEWVTAEKLSLRDALVDNGQEYSSETQIKFSEYGHSLSYSLFLDNITIYKQPENDLSLYAVSVVNEGPFYTENEQIQLTIINYGSVAQTDIPVSLEIDGPGGSVSLSQTFATSLEASDTATFVITEMVDLSAPGYYDIQGIIELSSDEWTSNDTLEVVSATSSRYEGALPYLVNFNDLEDTTYTPNQQDMLGLEGFGFTSSTDYGLLGIVNDTYYADSPILRLSRDSYNSAVNSLTLTLNLDTVDTDTENILLDFDFMVNGYTSSTYNQVFVRGSLSDDWISLYNWGTNKADNREWVNVTNLSLKDALQDNGQEYSSETQIKFSEYGYNLGYNLYLDNINIYRQLENDLSLYAVSVLNDGPFYTDSEQIELTIINYGSVTQTDIPVAVEVQGPNGSVSLEQTFSGSIASFDTATFVISETVDLSAAGYYQAQAVLELTADERASNDTLNVEIGTQTRYAGTLPYFVDFNALVDSTYTTHVQELQGIEGLGYIPSNDYGFMQVVKNSTYGESTVLKLSRDVYGYGLNDLIFTFNLDTVDTSTENILLDFDFAVYSPSSYSYNKVFVRGGLEDDWLVLYDWYANRGGNYEWINAAGLALRDTLVANGQQYTDATQVKISEYGYGPGDYLLVDNIRVYQPAEKDLLVNAASTSTEGPFFSSTEELEVSLINMGTNTQTEFPVSVEVTKPDGNILSLSETFEGSAAFRDTVDFTFAETLDLSVPGVYTFQVVSELSGDEWRYNDTLTFELNANARYNGVLPYLITMEGLEDTIYTSGQQVMTGLEGYGFSSTSGSGQVHVVTDPDNSYYGSSSGLRLTRGSYYSGVNDLVLTLNLDTLDSDEHNLLLDFDYSVYSAVEYSGNGVYVRGSTDDDWLKLYDWYANRSANLSWVNVLQLAVKDTLLANGQDYSGQTQIKFSEYGYSSSNSLLLDNIKVYLEPQNDVYLASSDLQEKSASLNEEQEFTIKLVNAGLTTINQVPFVVSVDGPSGNQLVRDTMNVEIASKDTVVFTSNQLLTFSEAGTYDVTIYSTWEQDEDQTNDTISFELTKVSKYTAGLPYIQDFESISDSSFSTSLDIGLEGVSFETNSTTGVLEIVTETIGTNDSHTAFLSRDGYGYTRNGLIVTADLSEYVASDVLLDFDFAHRYASYGNSYGTGVYVRGSELDDWVLIYDWYANKPSSYSEWKTVTKLRVSDVLAEYGQSVSESFQLKFQDYEYYPDEGFRVDNIHLFERAANDAQVLSLVKPASPSKLTDSETLTIGIVNQGRDTISSLPITYTVNGPDGEQIVSETASLSVAKLDTVFYSLESTFDLSQVGEYTLEAFVALEGDTLQQNDTLRSSFFRDLLFAGELPYFEEFETDSANFRTYGTNSSWTYDTLKNGTPGWLTMYNNEYGYNYNEYSYLQLPTFDFSEISNDILIGFDLNVSLESYYDRAWLEVSTDGYEFVKIYDDELEYADAESAWSGSAEINVSALNIEGLAGESEVIFRFVLKTDGSGRYEGVQLDNFQVYERFDKDLRPLSVTGPEWSPALGTDEIMSFLIVNDGTELIDSASFSLSVVSPEGDTVSVSEKARLDLAGLDTMSYSLANGLDLTTVGDYQLIGSVTFDGDPVTYNDQIKGNTYHQQLYSAGLPYVQEFESSFGTVSRTTGKVEGLEGFSFGLEGKGSLSRYNDSALSSNVLYLSASGTAEMKAILSIDLSNYSVVDNELLVNVKAYQRSYDTLNGIYVRGSHTEPWLLLQRPDYSDLYKWNSLEGLNISELLSENGQEFSSTTQVMFRNASSSYQRYDDFVIFERPNHDLKVTGLILPESGFEIDSDPVIYVDVTNLGSSTENTLPLRVSINGPNGLYEEDIEVASTLETDSSTHVALNGDFDFDRAGTYLVSVLSNLVSDTTSANDAQSGTLYHQSKFTQGLPYFESFTSLVDTVYDYARGQVGRYPGLAYFPSGSNGTLTVIEGTDDVSVKLSRSAYQSTSVANELILTIDLADESVSDDIFMDFTFRGDDYSNSGEDYILVRGDTSDAWLPLYNWLADADYSDYTTTSRIALADTLEANGQEFGAMTQVKFSQNATSSHYFLEISSIEIYTPPTEDLRLLSIEPIPMSVGHDSSKLIVDVINAGVNEVTSIPLVATATLDGTTETISFTSSETLQKGDTTTITFDSFFDLPSTGVYDLQVYLNGDVDERRYNDTLSTKTIVQSVYNGDIPLVWDFDDASLVTYTKSEAKLGAFDGLSYSISGNGKVSFVTIDQEANNRALKLSNDSYENVYTDLVFTLDLSEYDTLSDDIRFSFEVVDDLYSPNLVAYIRANDNSDWIYYGYLYEGISKINMASIFKEYEQQYSSTVQVKFAYNSRGYYGHFILDDFYVFDFNDNLAPQSLELTEETVLEDAGSVTQFAGKVSATDSDEQFGLSYSLYYNGVGDGDNYMFYLDGDSLYLYQNVSYEYDSILNINLRVTDTEGAYLDQAFEIKVEDVNDELNGLLLSNYSLVEANEDTVLVGYLLPQDDDLYDSYTYEFLDDELGADNDRFIVEEDQLLISKPNFELQNSFSLHIKVTEASGDSDTLATVIDVIDVNEAPTAIDIEITDISEDASIGTIVATFTATDEDLEDDSFIYVIGGSQSSKFDVEGNTMTLIDGFNISDDLTVPLKVTALDAGGLSLAVDFEVLVIDVIELGADNNQLLVYPNPTVNEVFIQNKFATKVEAFDLSGILIESKQIDGGKGSLQMADWNEGVYLLRVWVGDTFRDVKVIKQ